MIRISKFRGVAVTMALFGLFGIGTYFVKARSTKTLTAEYPDAPFEKLPENAFRFMEYGEAPPVSDKAARKAYEEVIRARYNYMRKLGAERDVTPEERKALDAYWNNKYVRGLELSEAILRDNPKSIPAMYVRANALANGDSNPPAALNQLQVLRRYLEECGRQNPGDAVAREWYLRSLYEEMSVLEMLGRDAESLRCVDLMEQITGPMPRLKIWPLFRLNRLDEAEAMIVAAEKTGKWSQHALNSRGTLELQRYQRSKTYETYKKVASLDPNNEVYQSNFGEAALKDFRFAEAEAGFLRAAKLALVSSRSSWYTTLSEIYLRQGRFAESIDALKKAQGQRARRLPSTWQYDRTQIDAMLATLLMNTSRTADAERIARRAYENPDRLRSSNLNESDKALATSLTFWSILQCRIAELKEVEATEAMFGTAFRTRQSLEAERWKLEKVITKLLDERLVRTTFSPLLGTSPEALLKILPRGVALSSIQVANDGDDHPAAAAYYAGYRAEVAYHNGRFDEAIEQAQAALEKLPGEAEELRCSRLRTIAAMAELQRGATSRCTALLDSVLETSPAALRMLDARVPVSLESDDSPAAQKLSELLARSPRLRIDPAGFRIRIRSTGDQLTLEMFRLNNVRHTEQAAAIAQDDIRATAVEVYQKLHERLATPAVSLDQQTINSLDGAPTSVAERNEIDAYVKYFNREK